MKKEFRIQVLEFGIQLMATQIISKFTEIKALMGNDFSEEMRKLAEQSEENRNHTHYYLPQTLELGGGLTDCVLANLFHRLGFTLPERMEGSEAGKTAELFLPCLAMQAAMETDADLRLFVKSLIEGTDRIGQNFCHRVGYIDKGGWSADHRELWLRYFLTHERWTF
jgi:hypothetical protein